VATKKTTAANGRGLCSSDDPSLIETDNTQSYDGDQEPIPSFLIGSLPANESFDRNCPFSRTLHGFSLRLRLWCVIALPCKRWGCRICGERKMTRLGWRCADARPNRLITLTIDTKLWSTPRTAYDGTKGKVTALAVRLRRVYEEFEYFKVLEVTKKGWPHYHLIVRSPYIPQAELSDLWSDLTGATIVDVRAIRRTADVYYYVVKYLGKQRHIPWTNRRVSWSKNFWNDPEFDPPPSLELTQIAIIREHPRDVISKHYHPFRLQSRSSTMWCVEESEGFELTAR